MAPPDHPQVCLTPGAIYEVGADDYGNVHIKVRVRHAGKRVKEYIFGHFGVVSEGEGDASKLKRYEEMYASRDAINKAVHDALEPVIGELYRTIWPLAFAGRVVDGEIMPPTYDEYLLGGKTRTKCDERGSTI